MPEKIYADELVENQFIQTIFLVTKKEIRTTKNGDPYLCLTLTDRTGNIEGRVWDEAERLAERFDNEDFVGLRAQVTSFNGSLQLKVDDIKTVADDDLDLRDYLPYSNWSPDEMFDQLLDLVDDYVASPVMRRFLHRVFDDEERVALFKKAPAAKSNHHEYFAGLLEHCLSMSRIGVRLTRHYAAYYPGFLNQDLVIAGCILHDIGKLEELGFERSVHYTTDGKMIGHITQGVELITAVARQMDPEPPADMIRQLKHLVLSHHGKNEYGSPIEPRTPEAMLLHEIDMIDSRMNLFHSHVADHRAGLNAEEPWTEYNRTVESDIHAGPAEPPEWAAPLTPADDDVIGPGALRGSASEGADSPDGQADDEADDAKTMDLFGG